MPQMADINFNIIMPELALLMFSFIIFMFAPLVRKQSAGMLVALIGVIVAIVFAFSGWNNPQGGYFGMVIADNFAVMAKIIFLLACGTAILLSHDYLNRLNLNRPEYYGLMLLSTIGMMIMASSTNLMVIFLGLEIMSLPLYVLAGFNRGNLKSNESAAKYFFMGAFASGFFLYGIALVYGGTGTTDLYNILSRTDTALVSNGIYLTVGAVLILVGFGFKIAAFPFHTWVPDVYTGAPTPVTAFFSVGPKAAGIIALLRIFMIGFAGMQDIFTIVFWLLAVFTMTIGNVLAVMQNDVKRMLAYSSIAHAGYLLVALTAGGAEAISAALYYLLAYGFFNMGAFAMVIIIEGKNGGSNHLSTYKGLVSKHPWLAVFLALFMFSLAGFPPTAGFVGKFYVFSAAVKAGFVWLVVLAVINSLISVFYYLKPLKMAFFEKPEDIGPEAEAEERSLKVAPLVALAIIITAIGTLGLGIIPESFIKLTTESIFAML